MMHASSNALALIKRFEGLRTTAYLCEAKKATIGYGHTAGVKLGDVCTQAQAEILLERDVAEIEVNLVRVLDADEIEITQSQFDALVVFIFNIGFNAFLGSTLLRKLKRGDIDGAACEFERWCKVKVKGYDGKYCYRESNGLKRRRLAEKQLFLSD